MTKHLRICTGSQADKLRFARPSRSQICSKIESDKTNAALNQVFLHLFCSNATFPCQIPELLPSSIEFCMKCHLKDHCLILVSASIVTHKSQPLCLGFYRQEVSVSMTTRSCRRRRRGGPGGRRGASTTPPWSAVSAAGVRAPLSDGASASAPGPP